MKKYEKVIGVIAAIMATIMTLSSIEILISNLKGTSHIYIQPLAMALNGLAWSLYSYIKKDNFILIPNILALIVGILTIESAFY